MNSAQDTLAGGLPHSEIPGSTIARISPGLFAACHVLHRLSVPRHPPDALLMLPYATPNGKHHRPNALRLVERCPGLDPGPIQVRHSSPFRRHFVTEPTGPENPMMENPMIRGNPGRRFRRGHTTRFFTIVHQQAPR